MRLAGGDLQESLPISDWDLMDLTSQNRVGAALRVHDLPLKSMPFALRCLPRADGGGGLLLNRWQAFTRLRNVQKLLSAMNTVPHQKIWASITSAFFSVP